MRWWPGLRGGVPQAFCQLGTDADPTAVANIYDAFFREKDGGGPNRQASKEEKATVRRAGWWA